MNTCLRLVVMATVIGAAIPVSGADELAALQATITTSLAAKSYDQALTQAEDALLTTGDNEIKQYALLTIGEIQLHYKRRPTLAMKPLSRLTNEYLPGSPYVVKAHYLLGSIYVEQNDAPRAFRHLREVPVASPYFQDAMVKLDWAAKNLENSVQLHFGFKIPVNRLSLVALFMDMAFVLLWTAQGVIPAFKKPAMWVVLFILLAGKIYASFMMFRITGT